jgi:hypothetical protein
MNALWSRFVFISSRAHDADADLEIRSRIAGDRQLIVLHTFTRPRRTGLPTTESELKLIATAAIFGRSKRPSAETNHAGRDGRRG